MPSVFYNNAKALFERQRYEDFLNYTRDLESRGEYTKVKAELYYWRGEAFMALENYDESSKAFSKVVALGGIAKANPRSESVPPPSIIAAIQEPLPPSAEDFLRTAQSKYDKLQYNEALSDLNQAIKLDCKFLAAIALRMQVNNRLRLFDDAIKDASYCIERNFGAAEAYKIRALSRPRPFGTTESQDDAQEAINRGIAADHSALYVIVAYKKFDNKDFVGAIEFATKAIACTTLPTAAAYLVKAKANFAKGDFSQVLLDAAACLSLNPNDYWDLKDNFRETSSFKSQALTLIADSYRKLNQQKDALKSEVTAFNFKKTVEVLPLVALTKFSIFANHGKVMTVGPSVFAEHVKEMIAIQAPFTPADAKVVAAAQSHQAKTKTKVDQITLSSQFNLLRAVLADNNITGESIHTIREMSQMPTLLPDLIDALYAEEERQVRMSR